MKRSFHYLFQRKDRIGLIKKIFSFVTAFTVVATSVFTASGLVSEHEPMVLKLAANTERAPYFGQSVSLNPSKRYEFSYCYTKGTQTYPMVFNDRTFITPDKFNISEDIVWSRTVVSFEIGSDAPDDIDNPGNKKMWVGLKASKVNKPIYFCNFKLCDVENPQVNLLNDPDLIQNGAGINTAVWKTPWDDGVNTSVYGKVTLESIGGINFFKKSLALKLAANTTGAPFFGQAVSLEPNKKYEFSYYYMPGTVTYPMLLKNGTDSWPDNSYTITEDSKSYKKIIRFKVVDDAPADINIPGNRIMWVGLRASKVDRDLYFYGFNLCDVENPAENLLRDSDFSQSNSNIDTNVWRTPWDTNINTSAYSKVSLESIGGIEVFKKTFNEVLALKYAKNQANESYFGQAVSLDANKEYVFSYCFTKMTDPNVRIYDNLSENSVTQSYVTYDKIRSQINVRFKPNSSAPDDPMLLGNKLVWVGLLGEANTNEDLYYYDFNLYEVGNLKDNLLSDAQFLNNEFQIDINIWKNPWGESVNTSAFSEVSLESIGNEDYFKNCQTALKLEADTKGQPFFGQVVSLNPYKCYVFSFYYSGVAEPLVRVYDNLTETPVVESITEYDAEWRKVNFKFTANETAPDDTAIPGNKLMWVGLRGQYVSNPIYCYGFVLYDTLNPDVNLLKDCDLSDGGPKINASVWKSPYNTAIRPEYSKASLDFAGGMYAFKKPQPNAVKVKANTTGKPYFGQTVSLNPNKNYEFSYYYSRGTALNGKVFGNLSENGMRDFSIKNDTEWSKMYIRFKPDSNAPDDNSNIGNKLVWVGFCAENFEADLYYCKFKLCDVNNPNINLLSDSDLYANGDNFDSSVWKTPYNDNISDSFVKVSVFSIGGTDYFKLPEIFKKSDVHTDGLLNILDLVKLKKCAADIKIPVENRGDLNNDGIVAGAADLALLIDSLLDDFDEAYFRFDSNADLLNTEVLQEAGANSQAFEMRRKVLNAGDITATASGTTYYVSQNGSDRFSGKSSWAPLKNLRTAISKAKSGDTVLLERGSVFRLAYSVPISSGITVGAYGTGAKPEVLGSYENYALQSKWRAYPVHNVWSMDCNLSDIGLIVFNNGLLAGNMKNGIAELEKDGDYFFNDVDKVLYLYCENGNPGLVYYDIEIGSRKTLFNLDDGARNVSIDNIAFKYTGNFAIHGTGGCSDISITNCVVAWIGGSFFPSKKDRYGNGIEFLAGCQNINIKNCWIYQIFDAGFTFQTNPATDGEEKEHIYNNINLVDNVIEYCSWAFEWWPSDSNCKISDIAVSGNIMRFSGYGWSADTRYPSHIRGPWSAKNITTDNFMISNNIFDCSNGPVYGWVLYDKNQFGNSLCGNSYYQKNPSASRNSIFELDYNGAGSGTVYAHNQRELEVVINGIDSEPNIIKWLN